MFVYLSKLTHWTTRINNCSIGIGIECLLKKYLNQRNQKIEMKFLRGCIHLKVFHGVGRCDVISFYFEELSPSFWRRKKYVKVPFGCFLFKWWGTKLCWKNVVSQRICWQALLQNIVPKFLIDKSLIKAQNET